MIKKNIGKIDLLIRISFVILVTILYFMDKIQGGTAIGLGVIAVIFLVTSLIRVCPLYLLFKISTKKQL